jgi:hypothetical protein
MHVIVRLVIDTALSPDLCLQASRIYTPSCVSYAFFTTIPAASRLACPRRPTGRERMHH